MSGPAPIPVIGQPLGPAVPPMPPPASPPAQPPPSEPMDPPRPWGAPSVHYSVAERHWLDEAERREAAQHASDEGPPSPMPFHAGSMMRWSGRTADECECEDK